MDQEMRIPWESGTLTAIVDHAEHPSAFLILAHGSGAGKDHDFMSGFSQAMAKRGVSVLRFNFPYMDAGKKFPNKAPVALAVWKHVREWAGTHLTGDLPVFTAGKSFGGRMASLAVAEDMPTEALIFLGYPLHAPKKEEKLRDEHLYPLSTPMLFLEGTRDPFANPAIISRVVAGLNADCELIWFEGGDHSFKVARSGRSVAEDGAQLTEATEKFIRRHLN
ncbi:dienelactone hydrolase [Arthrobacter sp. MYb211]|uniref:alpha/beta hydrolase family protein n=1 Tax=Micrococcaceae TaxID=1268 RepID=UPI000BB9A06F|nr:MULTISPECIES: alpha/beta family hydrolase [Micrococcaceae]PCC28839.1 dienelactone hydrolase [Glutamicibacter sp. BW80]PRA10973.1 dienelactone hydrolase [Arthrobacter sp. MYb221]PRC07127.1 dienelactone hydrolase [Arthrobacter sp. MYb211]